QKNILWFSISFFVSTLFFLALGVLIYHYAFQNNIAIPAASDELYPLLALNHFGTLAGIIFMLGIIAAAFSSADSALTALTTSFCIDLLNLPAKKGVNQERVRLGVHIMFSFSLFATIVIFDQINDKSVASAVFKSAGFTYGPLLGLYVFGLSNKWRIKDKWVPLVCLASPIASYILDRNAADWFNGYQFGFEILLINAALTFVGLTTLISKASTAAAN